MKPLAVSFLDIPESLCIITNNPQVASDSGVHRVEGSPLDVLDAVEKLLQSGYALLSAPLPPNIPLMRAPYRSMLMEKSTRRYDVEGLRSVAAARERYETQRAIKVSDLVMGEDFAAIDVTLLQRTLRDHELEKALR